MLRAGAVIPPEVGHRVRRLLVLAARGEAGERELADAEVARVLARHGAAMRRLDGEEARFTAGLLYETHDVLVVPLNHGEQVELVLLGAPADLADAVAAHLALVDWMRSAWEREMAASTDTRPSWSPTTMEAITLLGMMGPLYALQTLIQRPRLEDGHRRSFYLGLGQRLFERLEDRRRAEGRPEKPMLFEDEPVREEQRGAAPEAPARPAAPPSADQPPPGGPAPLPAPDPNVERGRRDAAVEIRAKRHAAKQGYSVGAQVPLAWARPLPRLPLALPPHEGW